MLLDEGRFFRQWAGNPLAVGAITPSGPDLARAMANYIEPSLPGPIVELGPGTGVVTKAILARGVETAKLTSVEYASDFTDLLRKRFPAITVVQGDAYDLHGCLGAAETPLAAIVSSLPLFTQPTDKRRALVLEGLERLAPGAPFIQFSYALVPPVREEPGLFSLARSGWIVRNMPPARVWVYRRTQA
ncbi:MAG: methyltransferase domain-containing protein [Devosiaceae bacterium]|nr:methyltransferase domain-containing protein [Devosiaceae bacterium MH13]